MRLSHRVMHGEVWPLEVWLVFEAAARMSPPLTG